MGMDPGADFDAHHIIPVKDGGVLADDLRDMLDRLNININDTDNGVLLQDAEHIDLHKDIDQYIERIYTRLQHAERSGGANAVRAELQAIGQELSQGVQDFLEGGL